LKKRLEDKDKENVIYRIKNTNKKWVLIRFWESDIKNDLKIIEKLIRLLIRSDKNESKFKNIIRKIKIYYSKKS
jgi:hypothetical protein